MYYIPTARAERIYMRLLGGATHSRWCCLPATKQQRHMTGMARTSATSTAASPARAPALRRQQALVAHLAAAAAPAAGTASCGASAGAEPAVAGAGIMTEEEKFRFDLTGYLVRESVLTRDEVAAIRDQILRIRDDPFSLPEAQRAVPSGPSAILVDHPKVLEVLNEVIGPDVRLENSYPIWREKDERHGGLHGGGDRQLDPIFGYRSNSGQIYAGMVRVVFELTDINEGDGATHFIPGSHKLAMPVHPDHLSLEPGERSPFLKSYSCPAGSVVFFTENLCHAGPPWQREDEPRVAVLNAYSHIATNWHRLYVPNGNQTTLQPWSLSQRTALNPDNQQPPLPHCPI